MSVESRTALDGTALRAHLGSVWSRIDVVAETGSTNADLLARAAAGDDIAGTVLLADFQNSGRGRHGRQWSAPPRSQISMSVGVATDGVPSDAWGWLPLLTGVAVVDAVTAVCPVPVGLKWPNDVLAGPGKLAGILAEVAAPSARIIIGLGLNVSLSAEEAPDPRATSLTLLGADAVDRTALAAAILDSLAARIQRWQAAGGADEALVNDYRSRSLTLGTQVRATLPGGNAIVGLARDIDAFGRLVIDDGEDTTTVAAGDITHLRPASS